MDTAGIDCWVSMGTQTKRGVARTLVDVNVMSELFDAGWQSVWIAAPVEPPNHMGPGQRQMRLFFLLSIHPSFLCRIFASRNG